MPELWHRPAFQSLVQHRQFHAQHASSSEYATPSSSGDTVHHPQLDAQRIPCLSVCTFLSKSLATLPSKILLASADNVACNNASTACPAQVSLRAALGRLRSGLFVLAESRGWQDNYAWLLTDSRTGKVAVVDPSEARPVQQALEKR